MNEPKKFAQATNLDLSADPLPDRARRSLSLGLGLLPMFPMLPGCGAGSDEIGPSGLSVLGKENSSASAPASETG
uniref:hypothetical protein n=1 Tax=Methylibium rhizosphaerae TaxID=2570323 RepID=UPI00112C95F2